MDVALIGGGFIVAKGDVLPYWWGVVVLSILVASLIAVLCGLMPTKGQARPHALGGLEAYQTWETSIIEMKKRAMLWGAGLLALAFAVGGWWGLPQRGHPSLKNPSRSKSYLTNLLRDE